MLRPVLIGCLLLAAASATAQTASTDSSSTDEPWYVRNIYRWFTQPEPTWSASSVGDGQRAEEPFLPFAGRPIRQVQVRGRKAFGEIVPDSTGGPAWLLGAARLTTSPLEGLLNDLYTGTREWVIRGYLVFAPGDPVDPFALADSERLLREAGFAADARVHVFPADAETSQVDVVVLVRDRWPYGADLDVQGTRGLDARAFHRNMVGLGLDLEAQFRYRSEVTSGPGVTVQLRRPNLGGSFVDGFARWQEAWDRDLRQIEMAREFRHPGVRWVGGAGFAAIDDHTTTTAQHSDLAWRESSGWFGRTWVLDHDKLGGRPRLRLVPAVGVFDVHYRHRPAVAAGEEQLYPSTTHVLGTVTLVGWENYRTSLVRGFGETEDIPAGVWLSLVGGREFSELDDRTYQGASVLVPSYRPFGRYLVGRVAYGGYRRGGRLEDGVLEAQVGGFSPLTFWSHLPWRHSFFFGYARGLHRRAREGLGFDERPGVRGFDPQDVRGDERLTGGVETVTFLPRSLLGFRVAAFAFADGGLIGPGDKPLLDGPLYASLGGGLRIKHPGLVFPTLQMRLARVRDGDDGWHTELVVHSGGDSFFDFLIPGVRPGVLPYR